MINEVFVIEIDKKGQILASDFGFGCLENFFFFFFAKPGQLVDLCLFRSTTMVAVNQFLSSVTVSAVGKERPYKIFHDLSLRKNAAGHGHRKHNRPHTKWTHASG